ncbi:MAG: hypothetical protein VYB65_04405 [Myxococcota bacterium]|nr:hypothetical protein [Myxococcota bacterium]
MMVRFTGASLFAWMLCSADLAEASCGLDQCPSDWVLKANSSTTLTSMTRLTQSALGTYLEEFVGVRTQLPWGLRGGLAAPLLYVTQLDASYAGLGNLVAVLDYSPKALSQVGLALGLQAELPSASAPQLGDGHVVLLPYARGWWKRGAWDARGQFGWGVVAEGGHHHHDHDHGAADAVSIVNPHTQSELLMRGSAGFEAIAEFTLRLGLDAVLELDGAEQLYAGTVAIERSWTQLSVGLVGELPLTERRRHDFRGRLIIDWRL